MHKWIGGSACAAAVLSLALASAQTSAGSARRITVTGCVMQGILTNATASNATASRSGSPSNEGTSAGNRNRTAGLGVSGSTSTVIGTSGTNATLGGNIDTEAHGAGTLGATDQAGSTVGAGATAGVAGASGTTSTTAATSYRLSGVTHPSEYSGKRVEMTGVVVNSRVNATPMLRVTSVRVLSKTCQ